MANDHVTKKQFSDLFFVKENPNDPNGKGYWSRVGSCLHHADGKGMTVYFDVPLMITSDTQLTIREREAK